MDRTHRTPPPDRAYTPDHLWARDDGGDVSVGLTPWFVVDPAPTRVAVRPPALGQRLFAAARAGSVEADKALIDLFAPCDGEVVAHHPCLADDPARCLRDPWNTWVWRMRGARVDALWSAARYLEHLERTR